MPPSSEHNPQQRGRLALAVITGVLTTITRVFATITGALGATRQQTTRNPPPEQPAMESRNSRDRDGSLQRLFCHECRNEWRGSEDSLECPRCQSSFTEIIENHNSTQDSVHETGLPYSGGFTAASIPETNGNMEQQVNERQSPFGQFPFGVRPAPRFGAQNDGGHVNDGDAVFRRFADMLMNDLGAGRVVHGGPGSGDLFPGDGSASQPATRVRPGHTTVRAGRVSFRASVSTIPSRATGGGGSVTNDPDRPPVTVSTYVIPTRGHLHPGGRAIRAVTIIDNRVTDANEPLRLFDQVFGNPWGAPAPDDAADPAFNLLHGLHQLLSTLHNPASAVHGDAVFTQEALDRIVTQLMEASPQTNAAPPATQAAIAKLEKKRVDEAMLGREGKAECTICIDDIKKGDEVLVLPCSHWYHGECVVLWLKEHNTCPICRMPIEDPKTDGHNSNVRPAAMTSDQWDSAFPPLS
ncbi:uncharacterized protein B0H64DRAFT_328527 [Chaetomium fimeti]|uniref:RING-type E3 ubiquitin transferase n=1 Tax=Chaetomium fimeti TaxID=1854472 RepID=A0AAE0H9C8_9PEZI|nr:hypothetical protein B0H64DRAFT_328527 [Chaetomium fimeti]